MKDDLSQLTLTKTAMKEGVWHGVITGSGETRPQIVVTHQDQPVPDVSLTHDPQAGHWLLRIPVPATAIADGVQTLLISDPDSAENLGQVTLLAGEALGDDIRAEMDLLRAELDMLKRAFRRHCVETG